MISYGKQTIEDDDINSVIEAMHSPYLTTGPKVEEFERELSKKLGFKYVVAVSSGTAALHLASKVLLHQGDRVITTPNSFVATSNSILYQKAKPIFVDIQENGLIDLNLVEEVLKRKRIKAIYLVTFSGLPFDDSDLNYLKERYNVKILIDNAHHFGGGECDIATYSFHPVKHITTFEGGAVATNDKKIYKKVLLLRNHGIVRRDNFYPWEYKMSELGFNYRLSDVASSLGLSQLKKVDRFLKRRREIARYYHKHLKDVTPIYPYSENSSYHLFVVRYPFQNFEQKAEFFNRMRERGIILQYHYIPINSQPFYNKKGYRFDKESFPIMAKHYLETFSLPIYPTLSKEKQNYIIDSLILSIQ